MNSIGAIALQGSLPRKSRSGRACGVTLPRVVDDSASGYISLLDECGGHTTEYHFHERLSCLYDSDIGGHSVKVGEGEDAASTPLYGKWEDRSTRRLPALDACGAHFGVTPDSNGEEAPLIELERNKRKEIVYLHVKKPHIYT